MESRRDFIKKVLGVGLTIPVTGLLAACGAPAAPTATAPAAPPTAAKAAPTTAPAPAPTTAPAPVPPTAVAAPTVAQAAPTTAPAASGGKLPLGNARWTTKYQGTKLNVVMADRPTTYLLRDKYLPDFTQMTGITVAFDVPPYEPQHQKSMLDLSSGGAAYDIYMIDFPWLAEFLNTNNIQPVDDFISAEDPTFLSDMIPRLVDAGGRGKDGRLYGVANIGTTFGVVYRSDLFEREAANYKGATGSDLKPPETWDEEIAIAKYFTQSLNPKSPTQYGIAMAGLPGNNAHNQFQFILWGVGGREVNEQYQATINNEKGVQAFTIVAELAKYAQPGLGGQSFDDMNNAFKLGKAVMQHNVTEYLPPDEADDSPVKGKIAYAWTPGHAPEIGGWSFLINSKSKNVNAAWEFVRWACGPELAKPLTLAGGTVPRVSAMTDPAVVKQFPWFPLLMEQFKVVQNRLSACPTCPGLIPEAQYELQVGTEVSNALTGNKTPKQAADDAAKALTKLMKDFGYAT